MQNKPAAYIQMAVMAEVYIRNICSDIKLRHVKYMTSS